MWKVLIERSQNTQSITVCHLRGLHSQRPVRVPMLTPVPKAWTNGRLLNRIFFDIMWMARCMCITSREHDKGCKPAKAV